MISADERQAVLLALLASGRLSSARLLGSHELAWGKTRQIVAAVEGNIALGDRSILMRLGLCPRFPLVLPHVFVAVPDAVGTIPHVEASGRICYRSEEGLLIDTRVPYQVLEEALDAALQTLAKGLSGENWHDFVDEIAAYWSQLTCARPIESYVEPDDRLRRLDVGARNREKPVFVADSIDSVRTFYNQYVASPPLHRALYVPLEASVLGERWNPRDFMSLEWTRSFVQRHLTKDNRKELEHLGRRPYSWALVLLGIPRPRGGRGLVGLEYRAVSGGSPLHRGKTTRPPRYIPLERRDRAITMARADGSIDLRKKRVVVAGCGAVGGHLALMLARAGVGHLTLVDPDTLVAENTFRHVLGRSGVRQRKVHALRYEISGKVPYIEVDVRDRPIEEVLQKRTIDFSGIDLLVYAAGDVTVGLHVNERIHQLADGLPMLFTWLEPYGIGGHALLARTGAPDARGCFGCLFDSPIDGEPRRNRADFAAPGQHFAKQVSGCATMYTPYADLDAVRTAELAARLALDSLRGRPVGHPVLSWRGDGEAFRAAGFLTSARYERGEKELHEERFSYARESCAVCGSQS